MKKKYFTRWILCLLTGVYGGHKFHEKNYAMGFLYLFTAGLFLIGWIVDSVRLTLYVFFKSEEELEQIETERVINLAAKKKENEELAREFRTERTRARLGKQTRNANQVISCPKCGGTQISAHKKGFGLGKAVVGTVTFGLLAGAGFGAVGKNKIYLSCMHCGHQWKPKR